MFTQRQRSGKVFGKVQAGTLVIVGNSIRKTPGGKEISTSFEDGEFDNGETHERHHFQGIFC